MPRYDFRNGSLPLARRRTAEKRALDVASTSALPAPVRAQKLADVVSLLSDVDLVAVLAGGVNLEAVLRRSLADRGLDFNGQWLGFADAEQAFDCWYSSNRRSEEGAHQGSGL